MTSNDAHRRKRRAALRKLSRREREARVDSGELDPDLDFVCPLCNGVYSLYYGRHKLHLLACKRRFAQAVKIPKKPQLPPPPPFESEPFPSLATTGERFTNPAV